MSQTKPPQRLFKVQALSAGSEVAVVAEERPVRIAGFVALLLGIVSVAAVFTPLFWPLAVISIVVALVALRRYSGQRPPGYRAAGVGLFLTVLFLSWGITDHRLRGNELGDQAERFSQMWLALLARGDVEMAMQLQEPPEARQPASMSLVDYYQNDPIGVEAMEMFRDNPAVTETLRAADEAHWVTDRPTEVNVHMGSYVVTTYWRDESGRVGGPLAIDLQFLPATEEQAAQWLVNGFRIAR